MADTELIVERNLAIVLRDGTTTYCDVFRPAIEAPRPVILHRTAYGKSRPPIAYLLLDPLRAADMGYVTVVQDVRGRSSGGGTFEPFFQEVDDGYDSVEWCAEQSWSNGRVGAIGSSYDGACVLLAAIARPPHLRCIVPVIAPADIYDGWVYSGGVLQWAFMVSWLLPWLAAEVAPLHGLVAELREVVDDLRTAWDRLDPAELPLVSQLAPYYLRWLEHRSRDGYWRRVGIRDRYAEISVPGLYVGGWYDIFASGTTRNFAALSGNGGESRLIMGPWAHTVPTTTSAGAVDFGLGSGQFPTSLGYDLEAEYLDFFDRWLRGRASTRPAVRIFVMGSKSWREERAWPPTGMVPTALYLHSGGRANGAGGDGELRWDAPRESAPPDRFRYDPEDPVPTVGGNLCCLPGQLAHGPLDQSRVEARQDVLVYRSAPLETSLEMTGPVMLELWFSTSAEDTDVTAKLVDVCTCGCVHNVVDGILRGRYRGGTEAVAPLPDQQPVRWTIDLGVTSVAFAPGHRVGLEISSSNFPRFERNLNRLGSGAPVIAEQSVYHDRDRASRLILPAMPDATDGSRLEATPSGP